MRNKIFKFFATLSVIISLASLVTSIDEYNRIDRYYYKYGEYWENVLERKEKIIETLNKYPYLNIEKITVEQEHPPYENLAEDFEIIDNSYLEMDRLVRQTNYFRKLIRIPLNIILFLISLYFLIFSFQENSSKKN